MENKVSRMNRGVHVVKNFAAMRDSVAGDLITDWLPFANFCVFGMAFFGAFL